MMTMRPCFPAKKGWLIIALCLCSVWLLRLDSGSITIFQFFSYSGCFIIFCVVVITTLHTLVTKLHTLVTKLYTLVTTLHTLVASPALVMNSCEVINAAENIGIFSLSKQNTFRFLSLLAKLNCSLRIPYSPEPQNALVYSLALTWTSAKLARQSNYTIGV